MLALTVFALCYAKEAGEIHADFAALVQGDVSDHVITEELDRNERRRGGWTTEFCNLCNGCCHWKGRGVVDEYARQSEVDTGTNLTRRFLIVQIGTRRLAALAAVVAS